MAMEEHERRRPLLIAALGFAMLETRPEPPGLTTLKGWLNSWTGLGAVLTGMVRQGYDVDLGSFGPHRWEATILTGNPMGGAPLIAGHAAAETPWRAVQRAAWQALTRNSA